MIQFFQLKDQKKKRRTKKKITKPQDYIIEDNKEENNLNQSLNQLITSNDFKINERKQLTKLNSNKTVKIYNTLEATNNDEINRKSRNNTFINKVNSIKKDLDNKTKINDYREIEKKKNSKFNKRRFRYGFKIKRKNKN